MSGEFDTDALYVPFDRVSALTDDDLKVFSESRFSDSRAEFSLLANHLFQKIATNTLTN